METATYNGALDLLVGFCVASSRPAVWAVKRDLKGSFKGDIDVNVDVDIRYR